MKFQGGKFDSPDRMFHGIHEEWQKCNIHQGCYKELIPEFFGEDDDFLQNKMKC